MKFPKFIILTFLLITWHLISSGHNGEKYLYKHTELSGNTGKPMKTMLNVNDFTAWFWASGTSGLSANGVDPGGFFPRGTAAVIYTEGLIWGGYVGEEVLPKAGGVTYVEGVKPGRILPSGQAQDPDHPEVRIYRIHKNYKQLTKEELRREAAELRLKDETEVTDSELDSVYQQYETDWLEWPAHLGAPFYDLNGNGNYEPESGESPGLYNADQVIWYVCNDLDDISRDVFGSTSIGLEIQVTAWAYDSNDPAAKTTLFRRNRIINKSGNIVDSMFVGLWSDPDIGQYANDFVGCDSVLGLAFAYNSTGVDADFTPFNINTPAVGYTFLDGKRTPATSFGYFSTYVGITEPCLGDYDCTLSHYNWLNGYMKTTNQPYRHLSGPDKGKITKFPLSGDPFRIIGDIDGQGENEGPNERSMLLSSGPVTFLPGDTLDVLDARVGGYGSPYHPYSVEWLRLNIKQIKALYPNFISRYDMPEPLLNGLAVDGKIQINWDSDPKSINRIENATKGHEFRLEGYHVWQVPFANAPIESGVKIATFDLPTQPNIIFGYQYDPSTGFHEYRPLITGYGTGLRRFISIEQDFIKQQNFIDGQPYHFAVTAYYYSDLEDLPFPVIESNPGYITIHAQSTNPGYDSFYGDTLQVFHAGRSTGSVIPLVVNPALITGHTYQVSFTDSRHWTVTDITDGVIKAENLTNLSGDYNYPIIDGIMPVVTGAETTRLSGWNSDDGRWISGFDWGGQEFFGGLDIGQNFFGSTLDHEDLVPVRLKFQDKEDILSTGYISSGAVYRKDQDYRYAGLGWLPFAAYDMYDPDHPRRLNICFVESDLANGTKANGIWDMGWFGVGFPVDDGAHEYIFIMSSSYADGVNYDDENKGINSDVLFAIWPKYRGLRPYLDKAFTMDIMVDIPNTPYDSFTYTSPGAGDIPDRFRVYPNYPNPFNNSTTIRYWLPARNQTRLEFFDIRGRRVATPVDQVQDQGEYYFYWQPGNIASGIYFCRLTSGPYSHLMKITLLR